MEQGTLSAIIRDQTIRALWEVGNVIGCIPDESWDKRYYSQPMWKHAYHMLHSLDKWFINPSARSFPEPFIHEAGLNDLDIPACKILTRKEIMDYFSDTKAKIINYLNSLRDEDLLAYPADCEFTKFTLIIAQHRHLHTHLGMLMGFILNDIGKWPRVLGLMGEMPMNCRPAGEFEIL